MQNTDDYFYNVKANITGSDDLAFKGIDYNDNVSPFDAICISEENEWHVINGVTDLIAGFVEDEIMPDKYYLQNQIISKCTDYSSLDYIKMGNYVTDRKPQGEFVFSSNSGTSDVVARKRVVMEPGSKLVPSGNAKIHLYTDPFSNCSFVSNRSFHVVPGVSQNFNSNIDNAIDTIELDKESSFVSIYPNPFKNNFTIEINTDFGSYVKYYILNMQGAVLINEEIHIPQHKGVYSKTISTTKLKTGIYLLYLFSESNVETIKVIKQ